jgi:hypothetical protein
MSELENRPIANIDDVDALERTLKELWASVGFEQHIETTATLNIFHHELFGCKWNRIDTGWLLEYLVAKRGQTLDSLLDMTIVEMAAILRDETGPRLPENDDRWLTVGDAAKVAGAESWILPVLRTTASSRRTAKRSTSAGSTKSAW